MPDSDSRRSRALELFLEHLKRRAAGESSDIDGLCTAHPDHAGELRALETAFGSLVQLQR